MSENTRSSAFRKIDVDQFNENFKDDEQPESQASTVIPDESEITKLINQYPLYCFLFNPPTHLRTLVESFNFFKPEYSSEQTRYNSLGTSKKKKKKNWF